MVPIVILFCTIVHQSFGQAPYADSYAPAYVRYRPNVQWVRPAHSLSESESEWVDGRKKVVFAALFEYLSPLKIQNYFSLPNYLEHIYASNYADVPVVSFAISGGGWASAYTGTGALRALGSRLPVAVQFKTGVYYSA